MKLENLKSALSSLSQDSGIGSSQEIISSFPCSDEIVVPTELLNKGTSVTPSSSTISTSKRSRKSSTNKQSKSSTSCFKPDLDSLKIYRKRYISESSSLSDFEIKKPKIDEKHLSQTSDFSSEGSTASFSSSQAEKEIEAIGSDENLNSPKSPKESVGKSAVPSSMSENSELCIICNNAPKDSIFVHTNIAHQCCCYKCAKRTLYTIKRCPICNRLVSKVVKIYTS